MSNVGDEFSGRTSVSHTTYVVKDTEGRGFDSPHLHYGLFFHEQCGRSPKKSSRGFDSHKKDSVISLLPKYSCIEVEVCHEHGCTITMAAIENITH